MPNILIEGAGIAGQVLHRELTEFGITSELIDKASFPREKVCGGVLQWDSWQYLNSRFSLTFPVKNIHQMSHFWRGKKISTINFPKPMVYISRFILDDTLNRQQTHPKIKEGPILKILASGAPHQEGEWLGFQAFCDPVKEMQMHYGRGIYLGISPTLENKAHVAFIVNKNFLTHADKLAEKIQKELGVYLTGPLKGTKKISYRLNRSKDLAIGDAKLTTHPFLGLGMKHAIESARLMARLIRENKTQEYSDLHGYYFKKWEWASRITGALFEGPGRGCLWILLKKPTLFLKAYHTLHDFSLD